jgi:hypothetical protein
VQRLRRVEGDKSWVGFVAWRAGFVARIYRGERRGRGDFDHGFHGWHGWERSVARDPLGKAGISWVDLPKIVGNVCTVLGLSGGAAKFNKIFEKFF